MLKKKITLFSKLMYLIVCFWKSGSLTLLRRLVQLFKKLPKNKKHLLSYTNTAIAGNFAPGVDITTPSPGITTSSTDIAMLSTDCHCIERGCHHIECWYRCFGRQVFECFMMFHNVLRVHHDVLHVFMMLHNVLQVFNDVLRVFHNV